MLPSVALQIQQAKILQGHPRGSREPSRSRSVSVELAKAVARRARKSVARKALMGTSIFRRFLRYAIIDHAKNSFWVKIVF